MVRNSGALPYRKSTRTPPIRPTSPAGLVLSSTSVRPSFSPCLPRSLPTATVLRYRRRDDQARARGRTAVNFPRFELGETMYSA